MDETNIRFTRMRKALGLTQEAVAKALNVTTRTVINWEGGHHEPRLTIRQTKALCQLLGIESIKDLPDNIFEPEPTDRPPSPDAIALNGGELN